MTRHFFLFFLTFLMLLFLVLCLLWVDLVTDNEKKQNHHGGSVGATKSFPLLDPTGARFPLYGLLPYKLLDVKPLSSSLGYRPTGAAAAAITKVTLVNNFWGARHLHFGHVKK
jgi:hypothetical protein